MWLELSLLFPNRFFRFLSMFATLYLKCNGCSEDQALWITSLITSPSLPKISAAHVACFHLPGNLLMFRLIKEDIKVQTHNCCHTTGHQESLQHVLQCWMHQSCLDIHLQYFELQAAACSSQTRPVINRVMYHEHNDLSRLRVGLSMLYRHLPRHTTKKHKGKAYQPPLISKSAQTL